MHFPCVGPSFNRRNSAIQSRDHLLVFVSARDRTALLLYFLALTKASKEPWDVSHHSAVWARALGLPEPTRSGGKGRISRHGPGWLIASSLCRRAAIV